MNPTSSESPSIAGVQRRRSSIDAASLPDLFAALHGDHEGPLVFIQSQSQGQISRRLAIGQALSIAPPRQGPPRLGQAYRRGMPILQQLDLTTTKPLAFVGWQCFDPEQPRSSLWESFGAQRFFLPRQTLDAVGDELWLTTLRYDGDTPATALSPEALDQLASAEPSPRSPLASWPSEEPIQETSRQAFRRQIEAIQDHGTAEKVVLARRRHLQTPRPIDIAALLTHLPRAHPQCITFAIWPGGEAPIFVGATPENLLTVQGGTVSTMALAGTTRNHAPGRSQGPTSARKDAESELFSSPKDRAEHQFVVDMIADSLHPYCRQLSIPDAPQIERLRDLSHLQTPIDGVLNDDAVAADLIDALHPTPAVCGVPRRTARPLIAELESFDRGLYAGTFGHLDNRGDGRFEVALRCGLVDGDQALLYAGAGITDDSDADVEYDEISAKLAAMEGAIQEVLDG